MSIHPRVRAGLVMFLNFFAWGAYLVPMGKYLAKSFPGDSAIIGLAYGIGPLAAMISPLLAGWIADRALAPRKLLALLSLLGGLLIGAVPYVHASGQFQGLLLAHSLCFFAALPILNSVVMASLEDPAKSFGSIRLWGTIGWIASGLLVGSLLSRLDPDIATGPWTFRLAGLALLAVAVLSPGLADPVRSEDAKSSGGMRDYAGLLGDLKFLVFLVCSCLFCIPLALYYAYANFYLSVSGLADSESWMTLGQVSEVVFLALLPVMLARFSAKTVLLAGMACWAVRYALFGYANGATAMLLGGVALHGLCYDFFFVTGQLYADKLAPAGMRNTAQAVVSWATLGLGMWIGNMVAPLLHARYIQVIDGKTLFDPMFWLIPSAFAAALLVVFAIVFRDNSRLTSESR